MSCEYENYVIRLDSLSGSSWTVGSGNQGSFTTHLLTPLKQVTELCVVTANFDASSSGSNVAYLNISQISPVFTRITNENNSRIASSIAVFNVDQTNRTIFNGKDYDNKVEFIYPLEKIDKLDIEMLNENGTVLDTQSNVFITLGVKCKRTNLCV